MIQLKGLHGDDVAYFTLQIPCTRSSFIYSWCSGGNTFDLYWNVVVQISAGLRVSEDFLSPSRQMQGQYLKLGHNRFYP
jgi:hypothetical protein